MEQIRAIIIDDEADARENLSNLLKKYCENVEVVAEADSPTKAFEVIRGEKPDLIFLDINMPEATGLEMLEKLGNVDFGIIFVTAYDQYALQAIKWSALDYLLKPINILDLKAAVEKAMGRLGADKSNKGLQEFIDQQKAGDKKISLSTSEGMMFVQISDIVRCESSDTYTTFHLTNKETIMIAKPLKEYENQLEAYNFFRIHQTHLINLTHVTKYMKGTGGTVEMTDGSVIGIARRKKDEFLESLGKLNS